MPYATSFWGTTLDNLIVKDEFLDGQEAKGRQAARNHGPYNALGYTLGDENYVSAFTPKGRFVDDPKLWKLFREFVRELYPDIGALNAQWGNRFADWESIRFASEKDMFGSLDNPSAWVNYRFFVARQFALVHRRMRNAIREEDPGAVVGYDGAEQYSSYDGYDWWEFAQEMDMANVYHTYFVPGEYTNKVFNGEALQSFTRPGALKGVWLNTADVQYGSEFATWYVFLNGWNRVWWWNFTFLHPANGALGWDLQPTAVAKGMVSSAWEIKKGPGTLLAHAEKQLDPIAVHYSAANWHASTIESSVGYHINHLGLKHDKWMAPYLYRGDETQREMWAGTTPKGHYAAASKNAYLLLHDLGFQPRTLARQEIEVGGLATTKTKVLFLPFTVALSDVEAKQIETFVQDGGTVIADYRCGMRDLHGKLREQGALDHVFGIQRQNGEVHRGRGFMTSDFADDSHGARMETVFRESILPVDARACGVHDDGQPAFFQNSFGEGQAFYLNADFYNYEELRRRGAERDVREQFRYILLKFGDARGVFVPEHVHGHAVGGLQVTRFRDGRTRYFGVLPDFYIDDKRPKTVRLPFAPGRHVYELRSRKYLRSDGSISDVLHPGKAKLYASLPYAISAVTLEAPSMVARDERVDVNVKLRAGGATVGFHAVRVEVVYPDGVRPEFLGRTLGLDNGTGNYSFTPALNAPRGAWRVQVVETMSGLESSVMVQVR